ncbi:MAG TPA: glycosyltransferase family 4 protein [Humisphaera sp.]|jgi:glycosyltransferase involved in cell wall biosynthesis|nr:glycosyltransferase family 4 protein [Humisphaera sp.]
MRIAWLGPIGEVGGGPSLGLLLLESVLRQGVAVDYFTGEGKLPASLDGFANLSVVTVSGWWQWGRWYSRRQMAAFISGALARAQGHNRLATILLDRHRRQPYDCVFQWSYSELFKLGRHLAELPPVIVYPGVHAAGELRWHRRESAYALKSEPALMHYAIRCILRFRSFMQRREMRKPALIIGLSRRFNELLVQDYGLSPQRMALLYHPIREAGETSIVENRRQPGSPIKLLFVGRISVRKGIEQLVQLSHSLDDLAGKIQIDVVGDRTQWSDYTAHLKELNPRTARFRGSIPHPDMPAVYDDADILLVPSMYEPGGLVVGEALSHGVCVVASDEVGSAEPIAGDCCRVFPAGDMAAFEACVRRLINDVTETPGLRARASEEARAHFAPAPAAARLLRLMYVCDRRKPTEGAAAVGVR